jgi:hypothetical protein
LIDRLTVAIVRKDGGLCEATIAELTSSVISPRRAQHEAEAVLRTLASSEVPAVRVVSSELARRYSLAHKTLPLETLDRLLADPNPDVVFTAAEAVRSIVDDETGWLNEQHLQQLAETYSHRCKA